MNKKGKLKSSLISEEFLTIYLNNMDGLIATARSNKVSTCLGIQDFASKIMVANRLMYCKLLSE